jgi:FMN phosphatase YigB (HAD superfamily)
VSRFVIFDLFHTLLDGADDERDRVVAEMAGIVGVEPAALVRAYHDMWRQRLTEWDAEETVRILAPSTTSGWPSPIRGRLLRGGRAAGCAALSR